MSERCQQVTSHFEFQLSAVTITDVLETATKRPAVSANGTIKPPVLARDCWSVAIRCRSP